MAETGRELQQHPRVNLTEPLEAFLGAVDHHLWGMEGRIRKDILAELRSHALDALQEAGGDTGAVLGRLGTPRRIALTYKEVYGYARTFQALTIAGVALLALLTFPVIPTGNGGVELTWASLAALVLLALSLAWISVRLGRQAGGWSGACACAVRLAGLASFLLIPTDATVVADPLNVVGFMVTSFLLVAVGYIPGKEKERWEGRRRVA